MQQLHCAASKDAILLIFEAIDAAGKDDAIRHVMSGVKPQGCQVFSFKHHEQVLVVRVHRSIVETSTASA